MSYVRWFNELQEIQDEAKGVVFSNDARLKELFEMTVAGDNNRLENAQARCKEAQTVYDQLQAELNESRRLMTREKNKLNELEKKCEDLKMKNKAPTNKTAGDMLTKLRHEIQQLQMIFKMYKDLTGVRFQFQCYPESVSGYVIVKGKSPNESALRPFSIKLPDQNVVEKIWTEISAVADNKI